VIAGPTFKSNMPGFGDQLGDDEIAAVIKFIKSAWPTDIRERQKQLSRRVGAREP
jgi:mono/diheme cytochrome c family protein